MIGTTIGGFELIEVLGQGGMAVVYKAHQKSLDRMVAVKVLSKNLSFSPDEIQRFRNEAQAAAQLKHSGIVQVYEAGSANGVHFIAMEYIQGTSVARWLQQQTRLTEANAIIIAESVAHALQHAWEKACLIHRDIKPDNILVDADGTVKVADLGLASVGHRASGSTPEDQILATPNYCSPEQAAGDPLLDVRSDIYSLGAMLVHLLTGKLPFEGLPPAQILEQQVKGHLDDPRTTVPGLSAPLCMMIRKMLAKDRKHRYADWTAVLTDLVAVKARRKPAQPLPLSARSTLKNYMPHKGSTSTATTGHAPAKAGTKTALKKVSSPSSQPPVGLVVTAILAAIVIAITVFVLAGRSRPRTIPDDRRTINRPDSATQTTTYDFGDGSWSTKP